MEEEADALEERAYWAAFGHVPYIGPSRIQRLIDRFGNLSTAWNAEGRELRAALDERSAESLQATRKSMNPGEDLLRIEKMGIDVVTLIDPRYPRLLRMIPAPPPVIYVKGTLEPQDDAAVAIVGTRRMSPHGRDAAAQIAGELAGAGVTVVSGLALGIDGVAHHSAVRAGGRTIAVLGSGVDIVYPYEHRNLASQVIEHGALISDYPPGRKPDAPNFPARNRIISGLSLAVVVVEAPIRSGALITVDFAADQGRDVFVVLGNALSESSAGSNRLLRDGARPVTCAADILEDLNLATDTVKQPVQQALPLTESERHLYNLVSGDPQHVDELLAAANLSIAEGLGIITMLELKGMIRDAGAKHFVRGAMS